MITLDGVELKAQDGVWELGITTKGLYQPIKTFYGRAIENGGIVNKSKCWWIRLHAQNEAEKLNNKI